MSDRKIFKHVLLTFIFWRIFLIFVTYFGISSIPLNEPLTSQLSRVALGTQYWDRWAQWDGGHFLGIAANGYLPIQAVFLPLFPLSIKFLTLFKIPLFWSGFILAQAFSVGALFYFYKLVKEEFNKTTADNSIFSLLIFPTAFYLGAVYSEGLFILLAVVSFYFLHKKSYFKASLFTGLSSITRLVGLGVIAGVFADYLLKPNFNFNLKYFFNSIFRRALFYTTILEIGISLLIQGTALFKDTIFVGVLVSLSSIIYIILLLFLLLSFIEFAVKWIDYSKIFTKEFLTLLLSFIPICLYGIFEYFTFGSPFALLTGESYWKRQFTLPWDTPLSYLQALITRGGINLISGELILELSVFFIFLGVFFYSLNKLRPSYIVFYFFALLLPLFSGTLVAIHRYYLVIFPFFIVITFIKNEYIRRFALYLSISLLGLLSIMFINGYWVT